LGSLIAVIVDSRIRNSGFTNPCNLRHLSPKWLQAFATGTFPSRENSIHLPTACSRGHVVRGPSGIEDSPIMPSRAKTGNAHLIPISAAFWPYSSGRALGIRQTLSQA